MWPLLSGILLLGWSVGANVAGNVFATAVGSRMVRFATAAALCAIFVVMGGAVNGLEGMATLAKFGAVGTLADAFSVAMASALAIGCMTVFGLPVSSSQTAIGALIGYQLVRYGRLDASNEVALRTIVVAWVSSPILAALTAFAIYKALARFSRRLTMPLFLLDGWLRLGLVAVGCYGSWAFGGNNIANVVSFYTRLDLFPPLDVGGLWTLSQPRLLALLGGFGIALGIGTSSRRMMMKVGRDLVRLDAVTAFIAIFSEALVLDFFARSWRFYTIVLPAIPISISQALVGSVVGLGLARGIQTIRLRILRNFIIGWIAAPILAAIFAAALLSGIAALARG
jgi:PiT family inorganic phosphate transporter